MQFVRCVFCVLFYFVCQGHGRRAQRPRDPPGGNHAQISRSPVELGWSPSYEEIVPNRMKELATLLFALHPRRLKLSQPVHKVKSLFSPAVREVRNFFNFLGRKGGAVPIHQAMMGLMVVAYGAQSLAPRASMLAGARINRAIIQGGEWHRLVSPVFLHGGLMHLASNLYSLYAVGPQVEASYGKARMLLLYLVSGVCGNLAGLYFGPGGMSIGASGAVFGMMGAVGGFVMRNRVSLGKSGDMLMQNVLRILLLNLFIGTRSRGIDNMAHIGGFVSGGILGAGIAPATGGRAKYANPYDGVVDEDSRRGDGAIVPEWGIRAMLAAICIGYMIGMRDAVENALAIVKRYGRN